MTSNSLPSPAPLDVAIIGMAAVMHGTAIVSRFWSNTLQGVDAITEIPSDKWNWRLYYDPDPRAPDKIISKWGGFLPDIQFDPIRYGMPPSSLPSIEPAQLIALEVVRTSLADARYADGPFPRANQRRARHGRRCRPARNGLSPSARISPCSTRSCPRPAVRPSSLARVCSRSGPRMPSPASCSTSPPVALPTG